MNQLDRDGMASGQAFVVKAEVENASNHLRREIGDAQKISSSR